MRTGSSSGRAAASARRPKLHAPSTSNVKNAAAISASRAVTASGEPWSGSESSAAARRRFACSWRPRKFSAAAQRAVRATRRRVSPAGTRSIASSSVATQRSRSPVERSTCARLISVRSRAASSASGRSRRAAPNQRAAAAGARGAVAAPASSSSSIAAASPATAGLLDVMGARRGRRPAGRQAARRARVCDEPPSPAGGLVDRAAHQRVAEREAPGHGGRMQQARCRAARRAPAVPRPATASRSRTRARARTGRPRSSPRRAACARERSARRAPPRARPPPCAGRRRPSPCGRPTCCAPGAARRERAAARRTGCRRSRGRSPRAGVRASSPPARLRHSASSREPSSSTVTAGAASAELRPAGARPVR